MNSPDFKANLVKLSNREFEVAEKVRHGFSNKEVANLLFVTEKTIKFHLTNVYKKLGVKSRAQLIVNMISVNGDTEQGSSEHNGGSAEEGPSVAVCRPNVETENLPIGAMM